MFFSERLVQLRKLHGLTQKQLATDLQLSELAIQHYESRRRKPAFDILISLASYFDVSLDYLVGRSDNPTKVSFSSSWEECFRERLSEILPNFDRVDLLDGGVDIEFLEAIADNKHYLTFHDACGIADELGVSLDYLVGLSDDPDRN